MRADTDDSRAFCPCADGNASTPEPISLTSAEEQLSLGAEEELMENVIALSREAAGPVTGGADVLVAEGLALTERNIYAGALNASLARNLEAERRFWCPA